MSEKFVCIECVEEPYLAGLVVQNAEAIECSFCEEQVEDGGSPIAASYDFLFEVVRAAVHREFQNPDDAGLPYDSEEGGYLGQVFNTSEIISELDASLWDEPNPFWENVIEDLGEYEIWCFRDPFSLKTGEILRTRALLASMESGIVAAFTLRVSIKPFSADRHTSAIAALDTSSVLPSAAEAITNWITCHR